jgi:hypothetical protein
MGESIRITFGDVSLAAELSDSPTAEAVFRALPFQGPGNRWGEEIYFAIPVHEKTAPDARAEMEVGELAYWPPGRAFCIFFGPTPSSDGEQPRAASPVNPIGRIVDDAQALGEAADGVTIFVERA